MKSEELFIGFVVLVIVAVLGYMIFSRGMGYETPPGYQQARNWCTASDGNHYPCPGSYRSHTNHRANLAASFTPEGECGPGLFWDGENCRTVNGSVSVSLYDNLYRDATLYGATTLFGAPYGSGGCGCG